MKCKFLFFLSLLLSLLVFSCDKSKDDDNNPDIPQAGTVKDVDNNTYNTIKIGTQWWMAENLKTTKYRNNTTITYPGNNGTNWSNNTTGAYAWYNDNPANKNSYGALYNWHAVKNSAGLCPTGWKVPAEKDWETLINHLGGNSVAGGKLKSQGTSYWENPNVAATNASGFNAKATGRRYFDGSYNNLKFFGHWWTSTEQFNATAKSMSLYHNDSEAKIIPEQKTIGFSVRCIKE
jgi:uncharacterized protein (TIGR02145 family)